jgi:hypothetical protein
MTAPIRISVKSIIAGALVILIAGSCAGIIVQRMRSGAWIGHTLLGDSAAYGNPLSGPLLDTRAELRVSPDIFEEPPDPGVTTPEHVMGGETPTRSNFRLQIAKILKIPLLVGVAEDEVEGAAEGGHKIVGVAETCINVCSHTRLLEVIKGLSVPLPVDLDGGHLSAGLRCRPGQPDRRMSGRRADLEDLPEIAGDDKIMEDFPILGGDVPIRP